MANFHSIPRYNPGFKGFGPMEQCADGKWVRFVDAYRANNDECWALDKLHKSMLDDASREVREARFELGEERRRSSNLRWLSTFIVLLLLVFANIGASPALRALVPSYEGFFLAVAGLLAFGWLGANIWYWATK